MVLTDATELSQQCHDWRQALRASRAEFQMLRQQLQDQALKHHDPEDLVQVEHFDNQFHIQLINIHDLKQSVKLLERTLQLESAVAGSPPVSEQTLARHDSLAESFHDLRDTLQHLKAEFEHFCSPS